MDRVFSAEGFGPVVTGTLLEGRPPPGPDRRPLSRGALCPGPGAPGPRPGHGPGPGRRAGGRQLSRRLAGGSAAGGRAGPAGSLTPSTLLDVRLRLLPGAHRQVKTGSQVHLHHGASVQLARVNLLDRDRLDPRPERPGPAAAQSASGRPGGGSVCDPLPLPRGDHRRRHGPGPRPCPAQAGRPGGLGDPVPPGIGQSCPAALPGRDGGGLVPSKA